jgi:hypothetical protein
VKRRVRVLVAWVLYVVGGLLVGLAFTFWYIAAWNEGPDPRYVDTGGLTFILAVVTLLMGLLTDPNTS